jgi:hypothetical protein
MRIISLPLLALSGILLAGLFNPVRAAEPGDGFDGLYAKRIELLTKRLAIYESVVDQASAVDAAKKWRALLPQEREIEQLTERLGQPDDERLAQLNRKYGKRLNALSTRTLKAGYGLAGEPYGKALHIAQLENRAEVEGSEEIRQALAMLKGDPGTLAALEAERKAATERRAAIKTDPAIDSAFNAYLAATRKLNALLNGIEDGDGAKEAAPRARKLLENWEAKGKAFNDFGPGAGNTTQKFYPKMKTDMGALIMTVHRLNRKRGTSEPLKEVLHRIMKAFADV